jgi:hypothetical protein
MNILEALSKNFLASKDSKKDTLSISDTNPNVDQSLTNDEETNGLTYGYFDSGSSGVSFYNTKKDDFTARVTKQNELIREYRRTANTPEVANAIDEIVNEATFVVSNENLVYLDFKDEAEVADKIKEAYVKNFEEILALLDFDYTADSLFRRYYIDGRLVLGVAFDNKAIKKGINNIKVMSPLSFVYDQNLSRYRYFYDTDGYSGVNYNEETIKKDMNTFSPEEIVTVDSGIYRDSFILSYLDVAIKTANQLQTLEDLLIPLRFSRSISRRVFNVDVGNLNGARAKQELKMMQNEFKYQKYYNVEKGTITNSSTIASIVEDYWFPNRGGAKGTVVDVLNETQNLGEVGDIDYFKKKLYEALKVPLGRMGGSEKGNLFDFSGTQIENDELKFFAMVNRLRQRFNTMFLELLRRHMVAKGIISNKEFAEYRHLIVIKWEKENNFLERQKIELFKSKVDLYTQVKDLEGDVYSRKWMLKNILGMTDEEIKQMKEEIDEENMSKEPEEGAIPPEEGTGEEEGGAVPPDEENSGVSSGGNKEIETDQNPEEGGQEFGGNFSNSMKNQ